MVAAHAKAKDESKDGEGKSKSKGKSKDKHHCKNCNKNGHTEDQCVEDGSRMARKVPDWWLKKHKGKGKEKMDKTKSANAVKAEEKDENYAFLSFLIIDTSNHIANDNVALAIISGHSHEAHAVSPLAGIIIDCGTSSHFSPSHEKRATPRAFGTGL
ncbi:hypothetical protein C0989_008278 [Termitomyces sp. Mn162]|nr:hypothetical protein C0989_008278 [Termitomyces sp. Mn162]